MSDEALKDLTCRSCGGVFVDPGGRLVICRRYGGQVRPRAAGAKRFLLDSNAYDPLVDDPTGRAIAVTACRDGRIELLLTHIQWDELCAIADAERRTTAANIPFVIVATYGLVLGTSRLGLARLGEAEKFEAIRNYSDKHSRDALLATTAQQEGAILVTNDRRVTRFARRAGIEVWSSRASTEFLQP